MTRLILAAFASVALSAAISSANAGPGNCPPFACGTDSNGTQMTGIAPASESSGVVSAVVLPSGEIVGGIAIEDVVDFRADQRRPGSVLAIKIGNRSQ